MILHLLFVCAVFGPGPALSQDSPPSVTITENQLLDHVAEVLEISQSLREEALIIREEAHDIRQEGYAVILKAYEATLASRAELENSLIDAVNLMMEEIRNPTRSAATELYVQEIRNTLESVVEKIDNLEVIVRDIETKVEAMDERIEAVDEKVVIVDGKVGVVDEKVEAVDEKVDTIDDICEETAAATNTVKSRLQVWMTEVRLISLYKIAEQTGTYQNSYGAELAVDGQFGFSSWSNNERTCSVTGTSNANNKLWIKLGGLFRIHKVKIWNVRHSSQADNIGTHVYANSTLLGEITSAQHVSEFVVSSQDAVYASTITLHQENARYLRLTEVQTWGTGPYSPDDLFD